MSFVGLDETTLGVYTCQTHLQMRLFHAVGRQGLRMDEKVEEDGHREAAIAEQRASATAPRGHTHALLETIESQLNAATLSQVKTGFLLPFSSARFLFRNTRLVPFVIMPALINLVLFGIAAFLLVGNIGGLVDWIWAKPVLEGFWSYILVGLWYLMYVVAVVVALLLSYALVLLAGGLVASPFNDVLSERTERILTGVEEMPATGRSFVADILRSAVSSGSIALVYAIIMVPILLLNLIPVAGSAIATVLGGAVSAFFLALEYTDPVLERYDFGVRDKFSMIRERLPLTGSFGLGTSLLLWIPLLNFLCMPIAVIGGTALGIALKDEPDDAPNQLDDG